METIYLIRGNICKFIKSFDMVIMAILKVAAYYLLFRYVSNINGLAGTGIMNSVPVHLILAVVSMLLPNRCGILLAIALVLFNMSQVTMLGMGVAALFFVTLYIMTSRLFPDHVYLLALVPICLYFKLYLLLPLIAGMYMGIVALIPMICGAIMSVMLTLIPEFMNLQMPKKLDELPLILSDVLKYGLNQILHNEELIFVAIVFTGVIILVSLLRKMEINYGAYIALVAGTVLGLVCLFMGKMTFGISDSYMGIVGRALLALLVTALVEFMHSALNYQSTQKLSFEDEEYQYYVTVIPKISVSKPKGEIKTITEVNPGKPEEILTEHKRTEQTVIVTSPTSSYQPLENQGSESKRSKHSEMPVVSYEEAKNEMPEPFVKEETSLSKGQQPEVSGFEKEDAQDSFDTPFELEEMLYEEPTEPPLKEPSVKKSGSREVVKEKQEKQEELLGSFFEDE